MRTRRGVDKESVAIYNPNEDQPVSDRFLSQVRLNRAIMKLWERVEGQSHLAGESQVVGTSIRVGIRIFSIVGGLGFVGGQFRGCGQWLLTGQGLRLLHRLKMPVGA